MRGITTPGLQRASSLAALVCWIVLVPVGLLTLSQTVPVTGVRGVAIVQTFTPYVVLALVPIVGYAVWQRRLVLGATAVVVGAGLLVLAAPLAFPQSQASPDLNAAGLRIAAANLYYENERIDEAADALAELDADVLIMVEYTQAHRDALLKHPLADRYPVRIEGLGLGPLGIAVWSAFPASATDVGLSSMAVAIQGPDEPIHLVAVHVPTPTSDFESWRTELDGLASLGSTNQERIVVIGDLNATYWHPAFRRILNAGFTDAHIAAGKGFRTSWPTNRWYPSFAQLDHALTTNDLVTTGIVDVDVPGSDHQGMVVSVVPAR